MERVIKFVGHCCVQSNTQAFGLDICVSNSEYEPHNERVHMIKQSMAARPLFAQQAFFRDVSRFGIRVDF